MPLINLTAYNGTDNGKSTAFVNTDFIACIEPGVLPAPAGTRITFSGGATVGVAEGIDEIRARWYAALNQR
jgi:hypothetical protein